MSLPLEEEAWTPTRLTQSARKLVEGSFGPLWLRGEVSGLKAYQSGHWYFALRDAGAQVRCVMWRTYTSRLRAAPAEGTQVYVQGTPTVWEERGEFRLTVTALLVTADLGLQQVELERTRAALERDGLLDPARKRPLPAFPSRIAIVTSLDGAALRDIITVSRKRWPSVELLVVGTKVQGVEAEAEMVRALGIAGRLEGVELCVLARGGGSKEDLGVFNREAVCRALAAVPVPTVSAVGHETDVSLTDLVADRRAATPSAAMELILPDREEEARHAASLASRLAHALSRGTRLARERLERTADRLEMQQARVLERSRHDLDRLGAQLDALSPLRVLERGYGVARDAAGRILRRRAEFPPGLAFRLRVVDGEVPARVEEGT